MNKVERRWHAAAERAAKRKGFQFGAPSVEVIHQEEKMSEPNIPFIKDASVSRKKYVKKDSTYNRKEKQDAEES